MEEGARAGDLRRASGYLLLGRAVGRMRACPSCSERLSCCLRRERSIEMKRHCWTLSMLARRGNHRGSSQTSFGTAKSFEHSVCASPGLLESVSMLQATRLEPANIPRPLFTGSGIVLSRPPSRSSASASLRLFVSCLAVKSPMLRPGTFLARFRFAGAERLMVVSGT